MGKEWTDTTFHGFVESPIVTSHTVKLAKHSWRRILDGQTLQQQQQSLSPVTSPRYNSSSTTTLSPVTQFYEHFYSYLFEHYPQTRHFFVDGGIKKRADSLIRMITVALDTVDRPVCVQSATFIALGRWHAGRLYANTHV
jgi:hypothetical protein